MNLMPLTIGHLPREILSEIFSYIPLNTLSKNVAPVCRLWSQIVKQTRFFKVITLDGNLLKYEPYQMLQRMNQSIEVLKLSNYSVRTTVVSDLFSSQWVKLVKLQINYFDISHKSVIIITSKCPNLTCLQITSSTIFEERCNPTEGNNFIGVNKIKHLNLSKSTYEIQTVAEISHAYNATPAMSATQEINIFNLNYSQIEYLNLLYTQECVTKKSFMIFMYKNLQSIRHMHLNAIELDNECMYQIVKCVQLESLTLQNITAQACDSIHDVVNIATLKYLDLRFFTYFDLQILFHKKDIQIQQLSISTYYVSATSNKTLSNIAKTCPNLTILNIDMWDVDDEAIITLACNCPKLEILNISRTNITGKCFRAMLGLHHIKYIYVQNCYKLDASLVREYVDITGRNVAHVLKENYYLPDSFQLESSCKCVN